MSTCYTIKNMFPVVSVQRPTYIPILDQIGRVFNQTDIVNVNQDLGNQNKVTGNKSAYQMQGQIGNRTCKRYSCSSLCLNRKFSTSSKNFTAKVNHRKNYYKILGVTPKCTDARIKQAYYRLSKVYHPDVNKTNEAVEKFHEITEAYEILSNSSLKHSYDSGRHGHVHGPVQRGVKSHMVNLSARGPHQYRATDNYNHEEWFKNHYSSAFEKSQEIKQERESFEAKASSRRNKFDSKLKYSDNSKHVSNGSPIGDTVTFLFLTTCIAFVALKVYTYAEKKRQK